MLYARSTLQQLFLTSFRLQHDYMTVKIASEMHSNAFQCIAQPDTTFACYCILYLTQHLYDPGTLPSSANQSILGKVYLRSNVSRRVILIYQGNDKLARLVNINATGRCVQLHPAVCVYFCSAKIRCTCRSHTVLLLYIHQ